MSLHRCWSGRFEFGRGLFAAWLLTLALGASPRGVFADDPASPTDANLDSQETAAAVVVDSGDDSRSSAAVLAEPLADLEGASPTNPPSGSFPGAPTVPGVRMGIDARTAELVERLLKEVREVEGQPRRMSLIEAVRVAVENNPGIRSQAEVPHRDAYAPLGATGAFDPKFRIDAQASDLKVPAGSALASGQLVFEEQAVRTGVSISKLLRTGADVDVNWSSQIADTNSRFALLNPRYDNRLTFSLTQPLLRNFWASEQSTLVLVARSQAAESLAAFETQLSNFVARVVDSYWRYVEAAAELEVSRRSVALARELVRDAEAKVGVGLLAKVAGIEAEADAAAREEREIVAENALVVAGRVLQHEVMYGAAAGQVPPTVLPVEQHLVTPVELDLATTLRTALESRSDIRGATFALARSRLEEKNARNQRLPSLNLLARYAMLGLSGNAQPVTDPQGNVQFSPYGGGYGASMSDWFDRGFSDYGVGLQLEVPFGNAEANAALAQSEIEVRRASRTLEQTVSTAALDVERALADVASAAKRVVASKIARELAEENLSNQTRRFELGAVTTKDVLDFQEKLAEAMAAEVRSITYHAQSLTRLRVADGTLLARFGIEIQNPDAPGEPWWYRF